MSKYLRRSCLVAVLAMTLAPLWGAPAARAHPHAFVEVFATFVFNDAGLAGVRQRWVLDPMLTVTVLDLIGEDHDGTLSEAEALAVRDQSFSVLKEYDVFTSVLVDGMPTPLEGTSDFRATLEGGKLYYEFFVPVTVPAEDDQREVQVGVFDRTFYTFVAYGTKDGKSIDPTRDPLFGNTAAGPNPGDYERFTEAVGLGKGVVDLKLDGPLERFDIATAVQPQPMMRYFYDQIVPSVLTVSFKRK